MTLPEPFAGFAPALDRAQAGLGLALATAQQRGLLQYLALVQKWTRVYNLTAVRDPADMLTHHLFDCMAAIPSLRAQLAGRAPGRILDVGAGAGLPGVVIATCLPDWQVTCVDTVAKKAAFVQQAAAELALPNLCGLHERVERLDEPHAVVASRAFATLADFTSWSRRALAPDGVWMALKGKHPAEEIAALPAEVDVFHVEQLQVPELQADRCIVWMRPAP